MFGKLEDNGIRAYAGFRKLCAELVIFFSQVVNLRLKTPDQRRRALPKLRRPFAQIRYHPDALSLDGGDLSLLDEASYCLFAPSYPFCRFGEGHFHLRVTPTLLAGYLSMILC